jgi:hypothetical protein
VLSTGREQQLTKWWGAIGQHSHRLVTVLFSLYHLVDTTGQLSIPSPFGLDQSALSQSNTLLSSQG